ncbi:unnamed protein product [Oncorhynchus mykiss]|uniref:Uncharacterized protein n=1 Tax=Oncorhynchus mykiss TaxID=8022 RepID=A0A060VY08_ONCMY|nr:unnamed protein product [Oncorhynchus mykiss]
MPRSEESDLLLVVDHQKKDKTDELSDLLSVIIEHQQPLDGIPDNDQPLDGIPDDDQPLDGIPDDDQPLDGIPDDDQPLDGIPDDDHLDISDKELSTNEERNVNRLEEPVHSECVPSTSAIASLREDAATTFQQRTKKMTMHEKLGREFHEHEMKYLNEEHEITILQVGLDMKLEERRMIQKR